MVGTIICNYNYGNYIADAIDSCLNQSVKNYPIIIDDGSTDNSIDIILSKLKIKKIIDQKIKIFHGENGSLLKLDHNYGPSIARNIGILNFNFDFYQILDADDILYYNKIEKLLEYMDPETGVVYGDYDILNMETNLIIREYKKSFSLEKLYNECIVHSGSLIRREAMISVMENGHIYDPSLLVAEDYDLWLRISKKWQIKHVPESLTLVRNHNLNSTNTRSKNIWDSCLKKIEEKNKRFSNA